MAKSLVSLVMFAILLGCAGVSGRDATPVRFSATLALEVPNDRGFRPGTVADEGPWVRASPKDRLWLWVDVPAPGQLVVLGREPDNDRWVLQATDVQAGEHQAFPSGLILETQLEELVVGWRAVPLITVGVVGESCLASGTGAGCVLADAVEEALPPRKKCRPHCTDDLDKQSIQTADGRPLFGWVESQYAEEAVSLRFAVLPRAED